MRKKTKKMPYPNTECSIEGCTELVWVKSRGWCSAHYQTWQRHGDPTVDGRLFGEANPAWKGANPTYVGAHRRCTLLWGKASEHPCVDCGNPADEWSYCHDDPTELTELMPETRAHATSSHRLVRYSAWPEFYAARCQSCHLAFDKVVV